MFKMYAIIILLLFKSEDTGFGNKEDPDALLSKTDKVNLILCYHRLLYFASRQATICILLIIY